jgi:hypothetical protein
VLGHYQATQESASRVQSVSVHSLALSGTTRLVFTQDSLAPARTTQTAHLPYRAQRDFDIQVTTLVYTEQGTQPLAIREDAPGQGRNITQAS